MKKYYPRIEELESRCTPATLSLVTQPLAYLGEDVQVELTVDKGLNVAGGDIEVTYDSNAFSISANDVHLSNELFNNNYFMVANTNYIGKVFAGFYTGLYYVEQSGILLDFDFHVKPSAPPGLSLFSIPASDAFYGLEGYYFKHTTDLADLYDNFYDVTLNGTSTNIQQNLPSVVNMSIPEDLAVNQGNNLTIPVNLDNPIGIVAGQAVIAFDPNVFTVSASDVSLGSLTQGWSLSANVSNNNIFIIFYGFDPLTTSQPGSLVTINFHTNDINGTSTTPVDLTGAQNANIYLTSGVYRLDSNPLTTNLISNLVSIYGPGQSLPDQKPIYSIVQPITVPPMDSNITGPTTLFVDNTNNVHITNASNIVGGEIVLQVSDSTSFVFPNFLQHSVEFLTPNVVLITFMAPVPLTYNDLVVVTAINPTSVVILPSYTSSNGYVIITSIYDNTYTNINTTIG